jgi:hypothetical protein
MQRGTILEFHLGHAFPAKALANLSNNKLETMRKCAEATILDFESTPSIPLNMSLTDMYLDIL